MLDYQLHFVVTTFCRFVWTTQRTITLQRFTWLWQLANLIQFSLQSPNQHRFNCDPAMGSHLLAIRTRVPCGSCWLLQLNSQPMSPCVAPDQTKSSNWIQYFKTNTHHASCIHQRGMFPRKRQHTWTQIYGACIWVGSQHFHLGNDQSRRHGHGNTAHCK